MRHALSVYGHVPVSALPWACWNWLQKQLQEPALSVESTDVAPFSARDHVAGTRITPSA